LAWVQSWKLHKGLIAGDFLTSRKAVRGERYTPKTIAAALAG